MLGCEIAHESAEQRRCARGSGGMNRDRTRAQAARKRGEGVSGRERERASDSRAEQSRAQTHKERGGEVLIMAIWRPWTAVMCSGMELASCTCMMKRGRATGWTRSLAW